MSLEKKKEFNSFKELTDALSPYISVRALARICGVSESTMLQYSSGKRDINRQTIELINQKLSTFAEELKKFKLKGA